MSPRKKTANPAEPGLNYPDYGRMEKAKLWMWLGIGSFLAIVAVLWIWSVKIKFNFLNLRSTPEYNLASQTQEDWDKIFEDQQKENKLEAAKEKLKTILSAMSASSTATTTEDASVTATAGTIAATSTTTTVKKK